MVNHANLLAFIQVAVAFDLGLVCFKNSHILKDIHSSFFDEQKKIHKDVVGEAETLIGRSLQRRDFSRRVHRDRVASALNDLKARLDPERCNWGKYAYLGLFGGIYAMVCLLVVGIIGWFDAPWDQRLYSFLLIAGALVLSMEFLAAIQISDIEKERASTSKVIVKVVWLMILLLVSFACAIMCWCYGCLEGLDGLFLGITAVAVYFPILTFSFLIVKNMLQIKRASIRCRNAASRFRKVIRET